MIEAQYRNPSYIPSPRTPQALTADQKGSILRPAADKPDLDFQTAGIELRWSNHSTVTIYPDATFGTEISQFAANRTGFIKSYAEPYYLIETGQHIVLPPGFQGLILPHPRFYDPVPGNTFNDFPAVVPRIVALDLSPTKLVILCRRPRWDCEHILYPGEPFCQIIPVPRGEIAITAMSSTDTHMWQDRAAFVSSRDKQLGGYEGFLTKLRKWGWSMIADVFPKTDEEAGA